MPSRAWSASVVPQQSFATSSLSYRLCARLAPYPSFTCRFRGMSPLQRFSTHFSCVKFENAVRVSFACLSLAASILSPLFMEGFNESIWFISLQSLFKLLNIILQVMGFRV